MTRALRLGFIPLNDCAALAVGEAMGFFAAEGLTVSLSREASWATIRDKVAVGALDGGHMLAPMVLTAGVGAGGAPAPLIAPIALSLNGAAITVSRSLAEALERLDPQGFAARSARPLARLVAARRAVGSGPLTLAVVFPYAVHNYLLRYWLAEAGVDPDADVRLVVVPPARTAGQLHAGVIDGFCAGAPWNAVAEAEQAGRIVAFGSDVWRDAPDKVLGVAEGWAAAEPATLQALLRALLRASAWADAPENRTALVSILARPEYVGAPPEVVGRSLGQGPDAVALHRRGANIPRRAHALWFLSQMLRWGQVAPEADLASLAARAYRPDLFEPAARALGETLAPEPTALGGFCDGRAFDPADPAGYAASFAITRV